MITATTLLAARTDVGIRFVKLIGLLGDVWIVNQNSTMNAHVGSFLVLPSDFQKSYTQSRRIDAFFSIIQQSTVPTVCSSNKPLRRRFAYQLFQSGRFTGFSIHGA